MPIVEPSPAPFFVAGGTMPADAPSYVERQADRDLQAALRAGEYCYVLDSRQVGKSSMLIRAMAVLRGEGTRVGSCDLQRLGSGLTAEQFYQGLHVQIGRGIGREREMLRAWQSHTAEPPFVRYIDGGRELSYNLGIAVAWHRRDKDRHSRQSIAVAATLSQQ